jgi:FkbM family methyltransferase
MSFISYAQNYEDVMLWRALKHIKKGFYIDVGANDPVADSITKAFYDRGWHGINIEPLKTHLQDLAATRTRDVNLLAAAGPEHGQIELWECEVRGWATASKEVIAMHEANGHVGCYHKVSVFPLKDICAQYGEADIHFLKIDVEGFEKNVIDGMDFEKYRPWIIVVESTMPNSTEEVHHLWEESILNNNYKLAYTDGLNRFYLASERSDLLIKLCYPPNILDGYIRVQQYEAELRAQQAEAKAEQAEVKAEQAEAKAEQAEVKAEQAEARAEQAAAKAVQAQSAAHSQAVELHALYSSTSWRITAPLRWPVHQVHLLRQHGLNSRVRALAKKVLKKLILLVIVRPKLLTFATRLVHRLGAADRLKPFVRSCLVTPSSAIENVGANYSTSVPSTDLANLSPRARQIYADLKVAIAQQNKGGL